LRTSVVIFGILLFLIGIVWTLQGINLLQGSVMSGDPFWSIVGIVLLIIGPILAYLGWRRGTPSSRV
jgi:hypothetical protein